MNNVAVIQTGGKQYVVTIGTKLRVEKLSEKQDAHVEFTDLLGKQRVTAKVIDRGKAKKIIVRKFRAKKRYRRTLGHRQSFTTLLIEQIGTEKLPSRKKAAESPKQKAKAVASAPAGPAAAKRARTPTNVGGATRGRVSASPGRERPKGAMPSRGKAQKS